MASCGFYMDLISIFPFNMFINTINIADESVVGQIAQLTICLQFWHIWDYMTKWEYNLRNNTKFLTIMKFTMILTILCYWSGCLLYLAACPRNLCQEQHWMERLTYKESKVYFTKRAKHENPTMTALFFGTAVFLGVGTNEVVPGIYDNIMVIGIFIFGSFVICVYMATICTVYILGATQRNKFKESMKELFNFLTTNRVNPQIKERVKQFFCVQWYYNNALTSEQLFDSMSDSWKQEVLLMEMVDTLTQSPLFQGCTRDFLQTVASKVYVTVLPCEEVVQHGGDISRDMYIIKKGHCNLLNHTGVEVNRIGPGNSFGFLEMLFGLPKVYTVMTSTNCVLLHIEYSKLVQCLSMFPEELQPVTEVLESAYFVANIMEYETARPMIGKSTIKKNRIANELKESFTPILDREAQVIYQKEFLKLGILRYLRYIIVPVTITPYGSFLKVLCLLRFMLACYYIFIGPYHVGIRASTLGTFSYWCDYALWIDLMLMAYVGYYDERRLLISHPLKTIYHYLTHTFILDFLAVFPIEYIVRIINNQVNIDLCRLNRLLQLHRITSAFQYLEGNITDIKQVVIIFKFLPIAVTFVNLATCLAFTKCCEAYVEPGTKYVLANCTKNMVPWVSGEHQYAFNIYILTFYWMLQTFLGCGVSLFKTDNLLHMCLVTLLPLVGLLYFGTMYGYIASRQSTARIRLLEHKDKTKDLENFLFQEKVDPGLTHKTMKYFDYVWKRTNGSNPQEICTKLNRALQQDVMVALYERTLREVPLLGRVERSFVRVLAQQLRELYFMRGDTVVQCRDLVPSIFIIYRGKVDVLSSYNEMITCMGPGGMFGNFTGQALSSSSVSICASRSLDLLIIPSHTFFSLAKCYPKVWKPISLAFENSKDYILPISIMESSHSEDSDSFSDSESSEFSTANMKKTARLSLHSSNSRSNISQNKSTYSTSTNISTMQVTQIRKPGSMMFQIVGYTTAFMATLSYCLSLYKLVTLNCCPIILWSQCLIDIYFYFVIFLRIHQGFLDRRGDMVTDYRRCRHRYMMSHWNVWSDIIINFPLDPFALIFRRPLVIVNYLCFMKIGRLKYLIQFYLQTSSLLINNTSILRAVVTAFSIVILLHTYALLWLCVAMLTRPMKTMRTLKLMENDAINIEPQIMWSYSTSMYVVATMITGTGGDEIVITEWPLVLLQGLFSLTGKLGSGIIVAVTCTVMNSAHHCLAEYEQRTLELIQVLKNQGLSGGKSTTDIFFNKIDKFDFQFRKFWQYTKELWLTERGRQLPELLQETPYVRRCDLTSAMFGPHLRNSYLFGDTGESFQRQLSSVLQYRIFFCGNYIVQDGDTDSSMYFVQSGRVSVLTVRPDLTESVHETLNSNDMFGVVQGLSHGVAHFFSYRAETKVSILILSADVLEELVSFFPDAKDIIYQRAETLFAKF